MDSLHLSPLNILSEDHSVPKRSSSNDVRCIQISLSALKMEDSIEPSLINTLTATMISSMSELEVENKLTTLAVKIIAFKAKGGDSEKLFNELERSLNNQLILAAQPEKDKIKHIRKHLSFLKSAINHSAEKTEASQSVAKHWCPQLLEKGKAMSEETVVGVQKALDNLRQLQQILPELPLETDLIAQFKKVRSTVEKLVEGLNKLENQENSFEEIIGAMATLIQQKQEMKQLIVNVQMAVEKWENQLGDKIRFQVDNESNVSENYGNKHARLLEQAELLSQIPLPGIKVPIPHGISNAQIQEFLKSSAPEIKTGWDELTQAYDDFISKEGIPSEFLKQPGVAEKLGAIHGSITEAFARAAEKDDSFEKLAVPQEFRSWMEELKANDSYLMVRSSGAEDTRNTANAGGNVSVAYVNPERKDLCHALGKVVVSYFSEGSLQNRLNAGDHPFSSPLRLAVTTQELIGESVGGSAKSSDIPVSLVLFSNEPMYVGNEPFRLMRISATWGHGEGVVGAAGVKSDTILLLKSVKHPDRLYIVENNQAKPKRLAPKLDAETGKIMLEKLDNPPELEGKPALDNTLLTRLFYLGVAVEKAYEGHPMDMEIVVKNGVIYPVQARPINRPPSNPTYFDWNKANVLNPSGIHSFQAEVILPGLAQTQVIQSKEEILIADNLEKAEKLFKKGTHKVVIVREEEPANSHPVVNFSGMGIPVMYHETSQPIQALVDQIGKNQVLVACVQSGNLVLWDTKVPPEASVSAGYTVHPAKVAVSVGNSRQSSSSKEPEVPQEIKNLTLKLRALDTHDVALEAVRSLKNQPFMEQIHTKRKELAKKISGTPNAPESAKTLEGGLEKLEKMMKSATSELKATLKKGRGERLHPLFHGKVVEALLQQPEAPRGLGQLSVVNAEAQLEAVDEIFRYQESFEFPTVLHEAVLADSACMTTEQKAQWKDFLTLVENAHHQGALPLADVEQFKQMLGVIGKLDLLPLWMARFFLPEAAKMDTQNISTTLSSLLKTMDPVTEKHLSEMQEVLQEIHTAQDNLNLFSDAATFDKGWKQLMVLHQKLACLDDTMKRNLESLQPLGRIATYQVMGAFVDLYDSSIKSMKASLAFTEEKKVELFTKMLSPYFEMLNGVTRQLSGNLLQYHPDWPLNTYLNKLIELFEESGNGVEQLKPSRNFNVSAGILGATTAFDRALPRTKEDTFTLIHQNLLFSLGALVGSEMKDQTELPPLLHQASKAATRLPVKLIGYSFSDDQAILNYNYPLLNHSGTFSIAFDKKSQSCSLNVKFLGEARARFDIMSDEILMLNYFKEFNLIKNPQTKGMELTYTMQLSDQKALDQDFRVLKKQAEYTMRRDDENTILEDIIKKYGEEAVVKCIKETNIHVSPLVQNYIIKNFHQEDNIVRKWDFLLDLCELELPDSSMARNQRCDFLRRLQMETIGNVSQEEKIKAKILEIALQPLSDKYLLIKLLNPRMLKITFTRSERRKIVFLPTVINSFLEYDKYNERLEALGEVGSSSISIFEWGLHVRDLLEGGEGIEEVKEILCEEAMDPWIKEILKENIECARRSQSISSANKNALEELLG